MNATAQQIVDGVTAMIFQPIVALLFAAGLLVFMWGMVEFIANPTDPTHKEKGKQHMIYGVIGLLIMVSVWGIVGLVTDALGIDCDGLRGGQQSIQPCK